MEISFIERLGMRLRKTPVKLISRNYELAKKNQIDVQVHQLEAHYLAGGNVDSLIQALILTKNAGKEIAFNRLVAVDLAGKDVIEVVKATFDEKEYSFDQYSSKFADKICGYCKDQSEVSAKCEVKYHKTINDAFASRLDLLQEHLSARIAFYINTAKSLETLDLEKDIHKTSLLKIATEIMPGTKEINLYYYKN